MADSRQLPWAYHNRAATSHSPI
ncbi:unnamed protein product [Acanthoscelides obtectus]|uniref:Uncharacterized protein n=1 Tax=Acanthoscelides obtectus TaxID=200917 RepID=A0A9P0LMX1_ACAOB|nr:unnamed protein product [Acanthoscelides obtectus]CAK1624121.1 hypothetical protein AOBTE_LOCUS2334 [Acanthoscelides obtectus]